MTTRNSNRRVTACFIAWIVTAGISPNVSFGDASSVTRTVPEIGDIRVASKLKSIRITFDQAMQAGFSITGGGDRLPKFIGKPRWINKKTLKLKVSLLPGHDYEFGINSKRFQNFKNLEGIPVKPIRFWFRTKSLQGATEVQQRLNRDNWDELLGNLRAHYSYYEHGGVDWPTRASEFEADVAQAVNVEEWVSLVVAFLSEAKDVHLTLTHEGKTIPTYRRHAVANYNVAILPSIILNMQGDTQEFAFGRTVDNIGYLLISTWGERLDREFDDLLDAMKVLQDTKALIVDVRPNNGGSELLARRVAARFISHKTLYAKSKQRDDSSKDGSWHTVDRYLSPAEAALRYTHPVIVLSGQRVMSSAEAFLLMMKQAPHCRLVGTRSYGSSGNPKPRILSNGVVVNLPSWQALDAEGVLFEGKGIEPDIHISASTRKLEHTDPVLAGALKLLRENPGETGE